MTLGERMKEYREREGLTQEQLAERLNVSRQAVAKWERDGGLPDIENLIELSRRMGVTLDELLGLTPKTAAAADAPIAEQAPAGAQGVSFPGVSATAREPANGQNTALSGAAAAGRDAARARGHAFAALGFLVAAFCWIISGLVNLTAAFSGRTPPYLPVLNFGSAALALYVAYAHARACAWCRRAKAAPEKSRPHREPE